jgi:hypothetical protein
MSPSGLQGFLAGGDPYEKTRERIRIWYLTTQASKRSDLPSETVRATIRSLLRGVPEDVQRDAEKRVLAAFAQAFDIGGIEHPGWLVEARAAME